MLELKGLYKTYDANLPTQTDLFKGLSYSVQAGDFISLVGSNGSGKTTLLNIIAGTIGCDRGEVILHGRNVTKLREHKRAASIARVFQDPKLGTCPTMTVAENLSMAANKGKSYGLRICLKKKDKHKFKDALKQLEMGLEDKLDVLAGQLSGGQRQALALVMATIVSPDLLLLDEHTAALDPRTSAHIMSLTEKIVMEKKITTLMVTHNLGYALDFGNRLTMLHAGNVLFDVVGEQKKEQTIDGLISMFHQAQDGVISDTLVFN